MRELKMKRFKNYAAKLRATIRQIKQDGGSSMGVTREDIAQHVGGGDKKKEKVSAVSLRSFFAFFASPLSHPIVHPLLQRPEKPAWALSAAEAEQVEEADVDDLLDFAQSLDFDKYAHSVCCGVSV
jgi:hypothetical protein